MNKFSDYVKNPIKIDEDISQNNSDNDVKNIINKYSELNKNELMKEFLKQSQIKKEKGGLNKEEINKMESVLFPYLNNEQKAMFNTLMSGLSDAT